MKSQYFYYLSSYPKCSCGRLDKNGGALRSAQVTRLRPGDFAVCFFSNSRRSATRATRLASRSYSDFLCDVRAGASYRVVCPTQGALSLSLKGDRVLVLDVCYNTVLTTPITKPFTSDSRVSSLGSLSGDGYCEGPRFIKDKS